MTPRASLYEQLLGPRYALLPAAVRRFHSLQGQHTLGGHIVVDGAESAIGRLLMRAMGFPPTSMARPLRFELDATPDREIWTRHMLARHTVTTLVLRDNHLVESFGPLRLRYEIEANATGLRMRAGRASLLGIPLPGFLTPRIETSEREADGRYAFDIRANWPGTRRLIAYRGTVDLDRPPVQR